MKYLYALFLVSCGSTDSIYPDAEHIFCKSGETCIEDYTILEYHYYTIDAFYMEGSEEVALNVEDESIFKVSHSDEILHIEVYNQSEETYIVAISFYD